jgi:hypothetical protein
LAGPVAAAAAAGPTLLLLLLLQAHISPHSVMVHGSFGRLAGPVATFSILRTTSSPSLITRPKTTCLLSNQSAGLAQNKKYHVILEIFEHCAPLAAHP